MKSTTTLIDCGRASAGGGAESTSKVCAGPETRADDEAQIIRTQSTAQERSRAH